MQPRRLSSGEEPIDYSELCIRVMEAFFEKVDKDDRFNQLYMDLYSMYSEVLQDELQPFAFELAVEAFGTEDVIRERRKVRDIALDRKETAGLLRKKTRPE